MQLTGIKRKTSFTFHKRAPSTLQEPSQAIASMSTYLRMIYQIYVTPTLRSRTSKDSLLSYNRQLVLSSSTFPHAFEARSRRVTPLFLHSSYPPNLLISHSPSATTSLLNIHLFSIIHSPPPSPIPPHGPVLSLSAPHNQANTPPPPPHLSNSGPYPSSPQPPLTPPIILRPPPHESPLPFGFPLLPRLAVSIVQAPLPKRRVSRRACVAHARR